MACMDSVATMNTIILYTSYRRIRDLMDKTSDFRSAVEMESICGHLLLQECISSTQLFTPSIVVLPYKTNLQCIIWVTICSDNYTIHQGVGGNMVTVLSSPAFNNNNIIVCTITLPVHVLHKS